LTPHTTLGLKVLLNFTDSKLIGGLVRVLLTGAGGFVGHHTLAHLLKTTDWEIVATDSFRHFGTSARIRAVFDELPNERTRVKVITHDLSTPIDSVTSAEFGEIDVIINMASDSHVDRSIVEPRPFVENNVALILTMLEYARTLPKLKSFIQIGTDEVYGPAPLGVNHQEWSPQVPSNPYSASKSAQEALAISYWRTFNVPVILTNTMNIIGERQDVEKFVPLILSNLLDSKAVPVHALQKDRKWRAGSRFYLHARNQADALRFIIEAFKDSPIRYTDGLTRPERFNVRGELEISNDEMVLLISRIMGLEKAREDLVNYINVEGTRPGHDLRYALDGSKLYGLGWKPPVAFEKSLERTVQWTLKNPAWIAKRS
jgi:dTDP-glucose 4,6-dehydratase